MTALGPGEIAARKRPGVILGVSALRVLSGICLAWPLASLLSNTGVGLRIEGDRALFESGGYLLLEVARRQGGELAAVARGLLPVLLLGLALTTACNAALLVALSVRERLRGAELLARAWSHLPSLLVLGAGTTLGQLLLGVVGLFGARAVPDFLAKPVLSTTLEAACWCAVALGAAALGGCSDVAKASLVRYEVSLPEALRRAWRCLKKRPLQACFGWLPYALAFAFAALLAAQLTSLLDVARSGAFRVATVLLAHQLVVVVSVAARAAWFARALRFVATHP